MNGDGRMRIVVTGTKNPSATSTRVDIDGFIVLK